MPTLIACLSTGKGTWTEVTQLIQSQLWTKVFLISNAFGQEKFSLKNENISFVLLDSCQNVSEAITHIKKQLDGKVTDFEVGLNFVSGTGEEHTAVLQAVMELGLNFRLVSVDQNGQMQVF